MEPVEILKCAITLIYRTRWKGLNGRGDWIIGRIILSNQMIMTDGMDYRQDNYGGSADDGQDNDCRIRLMEVELGPCILFLLRRLGISRKTKG